MRGSPWLAGLALGAVVAVAAEPTAVLSDVDSPGGLAAAPNGQTCLLVDEARRAIVAFEPGRPGRGRDVVAPAVDGTPAPIAVGWLPGDIALALCRAGDEWSLRTFRIRPGAAADPAEPLQELGIGAAAGSRPAVAVAVGQGGDWIVVAGLPPPLAPVLRARVDGVRIGRLSDRGCPRLEEAERVVAAAASPAGELLLVIRPAEAGDELAFFDAAGRGLLRLPAGIREVRDADFSREDGTLWATGLDAEAGGLWRLDATLRAGRQVVEAVRVAEVEAPGELVVPTPDAVVFVEASRRVQVIDPVDEAQEESP